MSETKTETKPEYKLRDRKANKGNSRSELKKAATLNLEAHELSFAQFKKVWNTESANDFYVYRAQEALTSTLEATTSAEKFRHLGTAKLLIAFLIVKTNELEAKEKAASLEILRNPV